MASHQQISMCGQQNGLVIIETRFGPKLVGKTPDGSYSNYNVEFLIFAKLM